MLSKSFSINFLSSAYSSVSNTVSNLFSLHVVLGMSTTLLSDFNASICVAYLFIQTNVPLKVYLTLIANDGSIFAK